MDNKKRLIDADELLNTSIRITGNIPLNNGRVQPIEAITVNQIESAPTVNAVELPCDMFDLLYGIWTIGIHEVVVIGFHIVDNNYITINTMCTEPEYEEYHMNIPAGLLGKEVFFTREEAEKALKEREENDKLRTD